MKTLAKNVPILGPSGEQYYCDILLGLYVDTLRPAIMLVASRPQNLGKDQLWEGSPIATASTNAPKGYLQPFSLAHGVAKTYSENEGLWEQLTPLLDKDGMPLFCLTEFKVSLGFSVCPVFLLGPSAAEAHAELLSALPSSKHPQKGIRHHG